MVPSSTCGSLASSKGAGDHLQSHRVPPVRLSHFWAPDASQIFVTAAQEQRGKSSRGPSSQILRFRAEMSFPVFSILSNGMRASPNLGSLRGCSAAPRRAGSCQPTVSYSRFHTTQWGDSSKVGIQKLSMPADAKQPAVQIALWQGRNLWVQIVSDAQRQLVWLSQGFKTNSLVYSKLTIPNFEISIFGTN